ncbi:non-ribosomal peptide synthetase [Saccharopolyspora phatthalungensis]|uniref:Phenyloxazoline synthase MbtB n=1 Tax=Saccharopolyspora phatthalungensis TaxID=664693 RepID=A0A840QJD8_9PSEU|nr:non-ribosomal peptide synthetase [Saccharopolyspora phatthalungensis]MBB5158995.1 amino acid adenylation domain-containing protein [Saccharopolyspora phatthalungensis]
MTSQQTHSPAHLVATLTESGVKLWAENDRLRYRAPKGVLTAELLAALKADKDAVLDLLRSDQVELVRDDAGRFEPFPLTDVQSAYLLGRSDAFGSGGVACHVYVEVSYPELDPDRLTAAWNRLIARHDMLRAVISADGYQRVLPEVPHYPVPVTDLRGADSGTVEAALESVRAELGHHVYDPAAWPLFDLRATRTDANAVLHVSLDFLIADWASIALLLGELAALHAEPDHELPELEVRFRDYLLTELRQRETGRYQRDLDYWTARLDTLPPAPDLPVAPHDQRPSFTRKQLRLDEDSWAEFTRRTQERGLTPSSAVLSAYAAVIARWSRTARFCLNLTVLNRLPLHPQVADVVGDFTSVNLLEVDWTAGRTFAERTRAVGDRLFDDLDHRLYSGVEVIRELARRRGRESALMPIVFTSAIGIGGDRAGTGATAGRFDGYGITQTPQVYIDCQAMDDEGGLRINWDVRDGVFPDGLVDDMFAAFEDLLRRLATSAGAWEAEHVVALPGWQAEQRHRVNDTAGAPPDFLLHQPVFDQARRTPDRLAVVDRRGATTYRELAGRAAAVADALRTGGISPGDRVAVVMDKGVEQVAAVLGVLLAGGVYLPIDTHQPPLRRAAILRDAGVRHVLTQSWVDETDEVEGVTRTCVDTLDPIEPWQVPDGDPDAPAYVIYTSGSTGKPKGVVIGHRAAANTIVDVNARFGVTAEDRVLGVANLGFDLSVYDIFGPLSLGGALVLPDPDRRADPSHWAELIAKHGVTLWNSVPALLQMLLAYLGAEPAGALSSLRLALLSGDWIPTTLPAQAQARLPRLELVGLGGATEAAIWSNFHRIDGVPEGWHSIPYGKPLTNQGFRVLDESYQDCPVWTPGELFITGAGLAQGYLGDPETTAHRFFTHPVDGQRLYRTGDIARYRPGGDLEFLGREDTQVKVRGHRVELGEIEAALLEHPAVAAAGVVFAEGTLFGVVECARTEPVPLDPRFARLVTDAAGDSPERAVAAVAYRAAMSAGRPLRILELSPVDGLADVLAGLDADHRRGTLDVDLDYRVQGYEPNTFDVVISRSAHDALVELLAPGGWLVVLASAGSADAELTLPGVTASRVKTDRAVVTEPELVSFLRERLPEHMVPSGVQVVDALPLTGNGKVDRRTLSGWRPTSGGNSAAPEPPADALEEALAARWAEALRLPAIGRTDDFFAKGADSLIMARTAGRLREELPEAAPVPFDTLLRHMLNEPTVAALAAFLRAAAAPAEVVTSGSNAALVPFSTGDGPVRVLFHAGLGTMECFRPLAAELVAQDLGPVLGIAIADTDVYRAIPPADVVGRLADDYTERLLAAGHTRFQLVGYCLGGMFATEVARRLGERGVELDDLVLVSSHLVAFDIEDDLMFETLFVPNLGISLDQVGFGELDPQAVARAFPALVRENGGRVPEGALARLDGAPGAVYAQLGSLSQEERFARYAETASRVAGQQMPPELALGMFRVFKHSFQSARFVPPPYFGDMRFLVPTGPSTFAPGLTEQMLSFWRDVCLGEFTVSEVDGDHFSCMNQPIVGQVADRIARPLRGGAR